MGFPCLHGVTYFPTLSNTASKGLQVTLYQTCISLYSHISIDLCALHCMGVLDLLLLHGYPFFETDISLYSHRRFPNVETNNS